MNDKIARGLGFRETLASLRELFADLLVPKQPKGSKTATKSPNIGR